MSMPSCIRPQRIPKPETTGPFTGQINPWPPGLIGPAGRTPVCCGQLLGDLLRDIGEVALEVVLLLSHLRQRGVLLATGGCELLRPLPQRQPGRLELLLSRRDLVAGRAHGVDGDLHLVAESRAPWRRCRCPGSEASRMYWVRATQVVEAVGLEEHGDQVGLVRLVDRDEPLLEDLDRLTEPLLQMIEPRLRLFELCLLLRELRRDRRPPASGDRRPRPSGGRAEPTRG